MIREEVIKNLFEMRDGMPFDKCKDWIDSTSIAIRSLEAWDKVINELHELEEPGHPTLVVTMRIDHLINLINKHLKTVEESIDDERRSN